MPTKRDGKRKKESKSSSEEQNLMDVLSASLSGKEVQQVLAGSLLVLDEGGLRRLAARLQPETMATLRRVLSPPVDAAAIKKPVPSVDKILEEWNSAWEEWSTCVAETGDESGGYVSQEHHWEPPYLDTSAFAEDLEPIAARMWALLPRVFERNLAPEFSFADSLRSTLEEVGADLPEWWEDSGEGVVFGSQVTRCLLEWEWRATRRDGLGAFEFLDKICELEESCGMGLDDEVVNEYILALEAGIQKEMLQGIISNIQSAHWTQALKYVYGGWFSLYSELCRRWDPARYLEACRSGIAQDWTLALPLIENLMARDEFQDALMLVGQTVRFMLHSGEKESFDPKKELLVCQGGLPCRGDESPATIALLKHWLKLAQTLHDEETAHALKFQLLTLRRWGAGDAVLEALRRFPTPRFDSMRERLYEEWRGLIARRSIESSGLGAEKHGSSWVQSLVDAARAGIQGTALLQSAIVAWMEDIGKTKASIMNGLPGLAVLTLDVDSDSQLATISQMLERILRRYEHGDRRVTDTRRAWLRRLGASELFPIVMRFWNRNLWRLVPEPENSGGAYEDCAEWLAAVRDLDRPSCEKILQEWKLKHRRRKNLWKALEHAGVSIL